jgi:hypothetical protein
MPRMTTTASDPPAPFLTHLPSTVNVYGNAKNIRNSASARMYIEYMQI